MDQLIQTIRAATANDATTEQKAAGVQACRTIIAALDTEPGKPLMPPTSPVSATHPTLDQMLDLVIARLTTIASAQDSTTAAPQKISAVPRQLPASPSRGLRVPTVIAPRPVARVARPAPTKYPTRKP